MRSSLVFILVHSMAIITAALPHGDVDEMIVYPEPDLDDAVVYPEPDPDSEVIYPDLYTDD
ncbi:hypothetical protein SAMD00023353_9200080 [Rosellinia necatrix]|uniref:Uncharacterized protein n=1 Tax=Rosellinia necatrix TaxID=77044 RepID=A0A1S8AAU7_ROSNE|nr:hypothetical protein SAMD00023353_9200080 [Rosellinia necatrix]